MIEESLFEAALERTIAAERGVLGRILAAFPPRRRIVRWSGTRTLRGRAEELPDDRTIAAGRDDLRAGPGARVRRRARGVPGPGLRRQPDVAGRGRGPPARRRTGRGPARPAGGRVSHRPDGHRADGRGHRPGYAAARN